MEGPRRAPRRLAAAACCLLAGLLLPLPGDGQETPTGQPAAPAQPSTVPGSLPLSEAGGFSPKATAPPGTSADEDVATLQPGASSPRPDEPDASSLLPDPEAATSTAPGLQPPAAAPSAQGTTGPPPEKLSANSSSELPPPDPAFNATDANQPGQRGRESSSNPGPTGVTTGAPAQPPTQDLLAATGSSQLEPSAFNTLGPTTGNPEPTTGNPELTPQTAHENATEQSTPGPTTVSAAMTTGSSPATTTPSTTTVTHRATSSTRAATTAILRPSAVSMHEKAAVLDVGDDDQDPPRAAVASVVGADPLVIGVISIFVVMVGILALVGFLRYRQRHSRPEFRRLQDLPMDDMMEDTPLSLYSY